jgi:hypothetical protein
MFGHILKMYSYLQNEVLVQYFLEKKEWTDGSAGIVFVQDRWDVQPELF